MFMWKKVKSGTDAAISWPRETSLRSKFMEGILWWHWISKPWLWVVGASLIAQLVKSPPVMRRPQFNCWVGKIPWRKNSLPTVAFLGFPCGSAGKISACNMGDLGSIPGLGRSPGEGKGYPLQYAGLENSIDCIVHGTTKSQTRLSDFHFLSC